jgi:hypothetical protein
MCRPLHFGYNEQTGQDNEFQHQPTGQSSEIQLKAMKEFDRAVQKLTDAGVEVLILEHDPELRLPDAVFPNNWFTTHADGSIRLYPMKTPNRQQEVAPQKLSRLLQQAGYRVTTIDLVKETLGTPGILEGTGAIVFDHTHRNAYAAISERCSEKLFLDYCEYYQWIPTSFVACSSHQQPIYHTNVMMSVGKDFAVVCSESIADAQRASVIEQLKQHKSHLLEISYLQAEQHFCANILELKSQSGDPVIAMSANAWLGFTPQQQRTLESLGNCVPCDIDTIEYVGGGSMRCMIAENFLPRV